MPRIRTVGDAIALRLPVHIDDKFQWIAEDLEMTPRELAAKILTEWVEAQTRRTGRAGVVSKTASHDRTTASAVVDEFFGSG